MRLAAHSKAAVSKRCASGEIAEKAELNVEEQMLDLLLPPPRSSATNLYDFETGANEAFGGDTGSDAAAGAANQDQTQSTREKLRTQLRSGKLDSRLIEIEIREKNFPVIELAGPQGVDVFVLIMSATLPGIDAPV